jgi:adenylate cyclase
MMQMPSIHNLRLGSGMVMWVYIASHLSNHALGLWSLAAAEQALRLAIVVWHSRLGTLVLYGAFATHLALALTGLYQRHTLRLPPQELLRIAFGLSFPLLLVGHAITTRVGYEWYGLLPEYQRVITSLISSGSEGRQIALLAPGWLHGCMGLNVAFRHRGFYQRWRWLFIALAIALPLTSAAGFLLMNQEIALLLQSPDWQYLAAKRLSKADAEVLANLRDQVLSIYGGLLLAVLLARTVRWAKSKF